MELKQLGNYVYDDKIVGTGQFSKVYRGYNLFSKEDVAIKNIDLGQLDESMIHMIDNEIAILSSFSHPHSHILRLHNVYQINNNLFILTEFCNQGDLQTLIKNTQLTEEQSIEIIAGILNGLSELKTKCTIHRDIKPANILFHNAVPKIADFGFAISKNIQTNFDVSSFNVGTPLYMAPESLISNHYSFKSDIWSAGIVLYQMLLRQVPFQSTTEPQLIAQLQQYSRCQILQYPKPVSQYVDQLLKKMLHPDQHLRWGVEQCLHYLADRRMRYERNNTQQEIPRSPQHSILVPQRKRELIHYGSQTRMSMNSFQGNSPQISTTSQENSPTVLIGSPKNENIEQQQFGQLLYKVIKLMPQLDQFDIVYNQYFYTKQDIGILFRKLEYCLLQCCCLQEAKQRQNILKLLILQQSELYANDVHFLRLLHQQESNIDSLSAYLKQCILITNEMFRQNEYYSNGNMIVLLDYMVSVYLLCNLKQNCMNWQEFNHKANLNKINSQLINFNVNRIHWEQINYRIQINLYS